MTKEATAEATVRNIRRKTRRKYSACTSKNGMVVFMNIAGNQYNTPP